MKKLLSLAAIAALPSTILTSSNLIRTDLYIPEAESDELRPAIMCGTSDDWGCGYKNTVMVSIDLTQLSLEKVNCIYPGLLDLLDCALDENDEHASLVKYRGHFMLVTLQQNILNIEYPTTREAGVAFRKHLNKCVYNGRIHLYMQAKESSFYLKAKDTGAGIMKLDPRISGICLYHINDETSKYKLLVMPAFSNSTETLIRKALSVGNDNACATYFHPATGELVIEVKFAVEEHDRVA